LNIWHGFAKKRPYKSSQKGKIRQAALTTRVGTTVIMRRASEQKLLLEKHVRLPSGKEKWYDRSGGGLVNILGYEAASGSGEQGNLQKNVARLVSKKKD